MTTNRKTILTLAAVATLAAALAPTNASAGFGFGRSGHSFGHDFGHDFGYGYGGHSFVSRPVWHRPVIVSWHRYTPPPVWHRPIESYGYARPHFYAPRTVSYYAAPPYSAPTAYAAPTPYAAKTTYAPRTVSYYAAPTYSAPTTYAAPTPYVAKTTYAATAPTYAAPRRPIVRAAAQAQDAVNGENVMLIEVPDAQFSMTGEGQWAKDGSKGEHFEFTEDKRDNSSVYLTDTSRGVKLQLDLSEKQVYELGASAKKAVFPILNASADVK